jgi:hypothetical protein
MTDYKIATKISLESLVHNLDRHALNAECQQWALAHGKCVDLNIKLLSYVHII